MRTPTSLRSPEPDDALYSDENRSEGYTANSPSQEPSEDGIVSDAHPSEDESDAYVPSLSAEQPSEDGFSDDGRPLDEDESEGHMPHPLLERPWGDDQLDSISDYDVGSEDENPDEPSRGVIPYNLSDNEARSEDENPDEPSRGVIPYDIFDNEARSEDENPNEDPYDASEDTYDDDSDDTSEDCEDEWRKEDDIYLSPQGMKHVIHNCFEPLFQPSPPESQEQTQEQRETLITDATVKALTALHVEPKTDAFSTLFVEVFKALDSTVFKPGPALERKKAFLEEAIEEFTTNEKGECFWSRVAIQPHNINTDILMEKYMEKRLAFIRWQNMPKPANVNTTLGGTRQWSRHSEPLVSGRPSNLSYKGEVPLSNERMAAQRAPRPVGYQWRNHNLVLDKVSQIMGAREEVRAKDVQTARAKRRLSRARQQLKEAHVLANVASYLGDPEAAARQRVASRNGDRVARMIGGVKKTYAAATVARVQLGAHTADAITLLSSWTRIWTAQQHQDSERRIQKRRDQKMKELLLKQQQAQQMSKDNADLACTEIRKGLNRGTLWIQKTRATYERLVKRVHDFRWELDLEGLADNDAIDIDDYDVLYGSYDINEVDGDELLDRRKAAFFARKELNDYLADMVEVVATCKKLGLSAQPMRSWSRRRIARNPEPTQEASMEATQSQPTQPALNFNTPPPTTTRPKEIVLPQPVKAKKERKAPPTTTRPKKIVLPKPLKAKKPRKARKTSKEKADNPLPSAKSTSKWTGEDEQLLFAAWADPQYEHSFGNITKAIHDGTIPMSYKGHTQQNVRDKLLNRKESALLNDGVLGKDWDHIRLDKGKEKRVAKKGKNTQRREADVDENGRPTNTQAQAAEVVA